MAIRTDELQAAWARVEGRYGSYRLVLPGEPGFICQPHSCDAYCCRAFNVAVDEGEVERLRTASRLPASRFLESEDGEVLALPLATPFVLGREEGHCVFLSEELSCEQYDARPSACRSYPHQVVFVDSASGRAAQPPAEAGGGRWRRWSRGGRWRGRCPSSCGTTSAPDSRGRLPRRRRGWGYSARRTRAPWAVGARW